MTELPPQAAGVDLLRLSGAGPLWGMASGDLNATLLAWPPGHGVAEHTNISFDSRPRRASNGPNVARRAHAARAVSGLSASAAGAPTAVSNARTVVNPELVISSRVSLRLPA